jgi:hypothetical protein
MGIMARQFNSGQLQTGSLFNISSSYAITASFALNGGGGNTFPFSGSAVITGSLYVSGGITGSLSGTASVALTAQTASYVLNAVSSSFATSASYATTASYILNAQTASFVLNAVSSSFASTASYVVTSLTASYVQLAQTSSYYAETDPIFVAKSASLATTGSNTFKGDQIVSGSIYLNSSSVIDSIGADIVIKAGVGNNAGVVLYNNAASQYLAVDSTGSYANKFTVAGLLTVQNAITTPPGQYFVASSDTSTEMSWGVPFAPSIAVQSGIGTGPAGTSIANTSTDSNGDALPTKYWNFNMDGTTSMPGGVTASSFTGSLLGTATTASFVTTAQTASFVLNAVSSSFATTAATASYVQTASYAQTASFVLPLNQNVIVTGSFSVSGSTTQVGNNNLLGQTNLSGSINISGSVNASANIALGGTLRLDPAQDPGSTNLTASFLFTSASNTAQGYDLYYRQDGNLVKFKWLEGGISSGLLYGGIISASGATIHVSSGSGVILNPNANFSSEISPQFTFVTWPNYSASAAYLTSSQNTYIYVDSVGTIHQQTQFFDQTQYEQAIPLGRATHPNYATITGVGSNVQTTYDSDNQQSAFIRAFGPLKIDGFSINAHPGTLGFGVGNGVAYTMGGFYPQDPNSPSHYHGAAFATSSIARAYRSGSGVRLDNNGGAFYSTVDPDYWDDGTGVLNTMAAGDWQIQRVFANPVTGRVVVYYGQNIYTTKINALQYLATDSFTEGEFTAHSLIFVGYLVLKGQTNNLTDATNNSIINSGIFRNIAGSSTSGGSIPQTLNDLGDVTITTPSNGQALVYNSGTWENGVLSLATTASYVLNAISSSFATTASFALTSSNAPNYLPLAGGTMTGDIYAAGRTFTLQDLLLGAGTMFGKITTDGSKYISVMPTYNVESARFWPNGNVTIQDAGTYVDNGFRLDVSGSGRFTDSLTAVNGITGSLFGTASFAVTASYALSSAGGPGGDTTAVEAQTWFLM